MCEISKKVHVSKFSCNQPGLVFADHMKRCGQPLSVIKLDEVELLKTFLQNIIEDYNMNNKYDM